MKVLAPKAQVSGDLLLFLFGTDGKLPIFSFFSYKLVGVTEIMTSLYSLWVSYRRSVL